MTLTAINTPQYHKYIADALIKGSNEAHWDRFIAESVKPERQYYVKMIEIFDEQLDDIMGNLQHFKSLKALEDYLLDAEKFRIQYNEFGQLMLPGIISAWAEIELEALEVGISFDVLDPKVLMAIRGRVNRFSDQVVNETLDELHRVIAQSIADGDGIPQLEKKIRELYANMSKYRAERIARTEVIWAQNEGAEQSYWQAGIEEKEWWSARDSRTCFWCLEMHGKRIAVGTSYFEVEDKLTVMVEDKPKTMTFNYEQVNHPPLHCSCRCTLLPVVDIGKAYMRYLAYKWYRGHDGDRG